MASKTTGNYLTVFAIPGEAKERVALNLAAADAVYDMGNGTYKVHIAGAQHTIKTKATLEDLTDGAEPIEADAPPAEPAAKK